MNVQTLSMHLNQYYLKCLAVYRNSFLFFYQGVQPVQWSVTGMII